MSRSRSPRSPFSWLDSITGLLSMEPGKEASRARPRRRTLRLEPLETRSLLSVSMSATIAGTVSYEAAGGGHPTATVRLYKDGGNGVFDNGGGDNSLVGATTTGANGQYEFTNITTAGVYFVEQMPIAGYTFASGQNVATVVVSNSDLQGTTGTPIDSFATTAQTASASFPEQHDRRLLCQHVRRGQRRQTCTSNSSRSTAACRLARIRPRPTPSISRPGRAPSALDELSGKDNRARIPAH